MGLAAWVAQNPGLTALSVIALLLTVYLIYVMVHPERF
jgi:K+-transporting ATPase KdpF subunit